LIWTAACASTAMTGIYDKVELLVKDHDGNIIPWSQSPIKWSDYAEREASFTRLSELFNVNHFIMSQANPLLIPFLSTEPGHRGVITKAVSLITGEVRHRLLQLDYLGLLPSVVKNMVEDKVSGNVTITPNVSASDFYQLLSNPTHAAVDYWILKGERSTWPFISLIRNRCAIERVLDLGFLNLQERDEEAHRAAYSVSNGRLRRPNSMY